MRRETHFRPVHAATVLGVAAGAVLLFVPTFVLESLTSTEWEVEILRFTGLVTAWLGLLWARESTEGVRTLRPARRRATVAWIVLASYLVTHTGLLLIVGFSLLLAAALDMSMERGFAYSEALRRQLGPGRPPSP